MPDDREETASEWYGRYYAAAALGEVGRKNKGRPQSSTEDRRARFRSWIEDIIGHVPMRAVTSADLRKVVRHLDEQIRVRLAFYRGESARDDKTGKKPGISAKTAQNVWSEVTNAFREACSSKVEALRVREDDPSRDVRPPESGDEREQAALFPAEVVTLLSCERIPAPRRVCYAVAIYTGMRRSELARLHAADVDFEHETIRVRGTKTIAARRTVPIELTIRPILVALVAAEDARIEHAKTEGVELAKGPLLDVPRADGKGGASDLVKKDLERAGVTREDLTRDDAEHMPFTFHGCRHTCITHWVVAGRNELFLLTAAGHTDREMTRRYLAAASSLSAKFGQPHPTIPTELADSIAQQLPNRPILTPNSWKLDKSKTGNPEGFPVVLTAPPLVTPAGIEPALPA